MILHPTERPGTRRRGIGLIEMALTGVLIVVAMVATMQAVGWVAVDRRAAERRERAVNEVANLMEQVASLPWDDLNAEKLATIQLPDASTSFLPGASLGLKAEPVPGEPGRKKVVVELRWNDRSGRPEAPARLVAWFDRQKEASR